MKTKKKNPTHKLSCVLLILNIQKNQKIYQSSLYSKVFVSVFIEQQRGFFTAKLKLK